MKPGLIYGIAFIVTIVLIIVINKKIKAQEQTKKTKIEKKARRSWKFKTWCWEGNFRNKIKRNESTNS